jgi:hypothetical protein
MLPGEANADLDQLGVVARRAPVRQLERVLEID